MCAACNGSVQLGIVRAQFLVLMELGVLVVCQHASHVGERGAHARIRFVCALDKPDPFLKEVCVLPAVSTISTCMRVVVR